jgi:tripartite-type tricarboxylate transporter receptor subunit TctC
MTLAGGAETCFAPKNAREDAVKTRARLLLGVTIALIALACAPPLSADDYPARPVRVVIGFGPGAVADLAARAVGTRMSAILGQQIVVENRPGAGSSIAAEYVARAPKDGYTLLMATVANTINAAISTLPFDFGKDLAPVALVANVPNVLVVHPSLGVSSVRELIALAKAKPEQLFYASAGAGTLGHLSGVLLNIRAGVKLVHVPYPGSPQGVTDLLAGRVSVMFSPASTVWPHVQAGRLKALATTETKRAAIAPDLPTMAEAGLPGYDTGIWIGLLAPAGTSRAVIDKLASALNDALKADEVLTALRAQSVEPLGGSPEEFARHIETDTSNWTAVTKAAGLKK